MVLPLISEVMCMIPFWSLGGHMQTTSELQAARPSGCLAGNRSSSLGTGRRAKCSVGPCCSKFNWSLLDGPGPRRPEGYESGVMAETVSELCIDGHLTEAVEALGVLVQTQSCIPKFLLYTVLKSCIVRKDLVLGRRVHACVVKQGHGSDTFLCNHILRMYASYGRLQDAMDVFTLLAKPDAFTFSAIISAHVRHGEDKRALELYHQMHRSSVKPDGHVFVAALQACAKRTDLKTGQEVHAHVLASEVEPDLFVWNCLVDMYAKCGSLEEAQRVFDGLAQKDVVSWTALIAGYSHRGMGQEALCLYSAMQEEGMAVPNSVTFVCLLQACASVGGPALEKGKQLHVQITGGGYETDVFVANSLVNMYAKCGSIEDAQRLFDGHGGKDVVTWNAMIAGYFQQGMVVEALRLYSDMLREGLTAPNSVTYVCLLQACASVGSLALEKGKELHTRIREQGYEADVLVANSLVNMYAKCGSLEDAQRLFDGLGQKDVVTWTTLIAGYSQQGMAQESLRLYSAMQEDDMVVPDPVTFMCLLQVCASVGTPALEKGKQLHVQIREHKLDADLSLANSLVDMYAKCGSLELAQRVFDGLGHKDVVMWNAMIARYSQQGMGQEALCLYSAMLEEGISLPDSVTFVCLLQACASLGTPALEKGKQLHVQIREQGHQSDGFVVSSLINMYAKCGGLEDARRLFDGLDYKDVVTWNAMIAGYSQQSLGQEALGLYIAMQEEGMAAPNSVTFVCLLQACTSIGTPALAKGKHLHAQIRKRGYQADVSVANSLVNMYAKCGSLEDAQSVFDGLVDKDVVTWNAMIAGYSQQGRGQEALRLYSVMQEEMAVPDPLTFVSLLQACASIGPLAFKKGKLLHTQIREHGHEAQAFVASSLANMYAKCGSLEDAQRMFDGLSRKDVGTWNAIIAGYSQQGRGHEALRVYSAMREDGMAIPNSVTFVCLLQACSSMGSPALDKGKELHAHIRERGHQVDVFLASSLVNMYAQCGSVEDARRVFDGLGEKNVVTWNAMIAAYSQLGMSQEALCVYTSMQEEDMVAPDSVTFVCLLQACADLGALHLGRQLHVQIQEQKLQVDLLVAGSLINMYGKSGSMIDAQQVFDALPERDAATWSTLIAGYSCQGDNETVFALIQRMKEDRIQPVGITFVCILTVCSHVGLVNEGMQYFRAMTRDHGISPTVEHYTCMVDLLGRAGRLDEALALARTMPVSPNAAVWHTLLGACRKWSNVEVGRNAFNEAVKLDKKDAAAYALMSNIYTGAQMWEQAEATQARRTRIGAWKEPGQTWWTDMDGQVHSFLVWNQQHPNGLIA